MENHKRNTGLYIIIGVLVLVNIATLGSMWYFRSAVKSNLMIHKGLQQGLPPGQPHGQPFGQPFGQPPGQPPHGQPQGILPGPGGIEMILNEEINFSDEQMTAFIPLREKHKQQTSLLLSDMQKLKGEIINTVLSGDDTKANEISLQIGEKQKQLEFNVYDHFKSIRNICTDKQKPKFDSFVGDMGKMLAPPIGQPPIGPPPDGKIRPQDDINRKPPVPPDGIPGDIPKK